MNAKNKTANADNLAESEARFRTALSRLAEALVQVNSLRNRAQKLDGENATLKEGLTRLTGDYEALEKSFLELKDKQKQGASSGDAGGDTALQGELKTVRSDYEAMEQSYNLLKAQYLEAREETDDARRKLKAIKIQNIAANGALDEDDAISQLKAGIVAQLDGTIGRLESILATTDA